MEEYITTDLALAVYLTLEGHEHQRMEMKNGMAGWVFAAVGNLPELVGSYVTDDCNADVQDTVRTAAKLKRDMYSFLNGARA